jgi:sterol desaturase/sphingolipid hydroxylase (fatty acid hydroxylase superfamily)
VALVRNLGIIVAAMAALALLESVVPFRSGAWRRRHLAPNLGLSGATLALNFALGVAGTLAVEWLRARGIGAFATVAVSRAVMVVAGVVALDFATWALHWSMHHVPAWWRVHRVHHSDPLVDVTTALRQHPLEGVLRFAAIFVVAIALGLPTAVVTLYRSISAINALLEHANVHWWPPLDRALSLALVTPNMHKVHHSRLQRETNSNYGNILSLFDRIFRTFTPTARASRVRYGLAGDDTLPAQRLSTLLRQPFRRRP